MDELFPTGYLIIHGRTLEGPQFRPSDWAERLAGVLSRFRPPGAPQNLLAYAPYAIPRMLDGIPCVIIEHRLRQLEPLAWKFALDFAKSNSLRTTDAKEEP